MSEKELEMELEKQQLEKILKEEKQTNKRLIVSRNLELTWNCRFAHSNNGFKCPKRVIFAMRSGQYGTQTGL